MNEKIPVGQDMQAAGLSIREVIRTVMDHALVTRPKTDVDFRPFTPCRAVGFTKVLGSIRVDLDALYPEAAPESGAVCEFGISCSKTEQIYLNISPDTMVWFDGNCVYDDIAHTADTSVRLPDDKPDTLRHVPLTVTAGAENRVRVGCKKRAQTAFGFEFLISVHRYPGMWANDYLFAARAVLLPPKHRGEDGIAISELLPESEWEAPDIPWRWPETLPQSENFDFTKLCGAGDAAYVYTQALADHTLCVSGTIERVFVNNAHAQPTENGKLFVRKGDKILFRCTRQQEQWGLALDTAKLGLPFLKSTRGRCDKAIWVGPFYGAQCFGPEYDWDFSRIFVNTKGEQLYWRFCDGSELRLTLDSVFYGQWFYALMVGFYGIREAAAYLGDTARQRLFVENMQTLNHYFDYIQFDIHAHVMPAFMPRTAVLDVLDNIGTMGMNLLDAYFDSSDRTLVPLIEKLAAQAEHAIPRLPDGAYYRQDTMWADDLYMSCPFLVRMAKLTGDDTWLQKAAAQVRGFRDRLYMQDERLFSHIWFPEENAANRVPWGRGNGWVMWTLTEILTAADGRSGFEDLIELFRTMAVRLRELQGADGLWRQVLNREETGSYPETSCTGMFLLAMTRGVKNGWLDKCFLPCMERAWNGLLRCSIDRTGNVYGVCMGSGCAHEAEYYYKIPTTINDDHGTGVILAVASEYAALLEALQEDTE